MKTSLTVFQLPVSEISSIFSHSAILVCSHFPACLLHPDTSFTDTDTGFNPNNTLAGPSIDNPLGNPVFPGFTSAGNFPAENWVCNTHNDRAESILICYLQVGFLVNTFNKTRTFSYNFAFSGATLDSALATPFSPTVVSVKNQIQQEFLPGLGLKPTAVPWKAEDSLFAIL